MPVSILPFRIYAGPVGQTSVGMAHAGRQSQLLGHSVQWHRQAGRDRLQQTANIVVVVIIVIIVVIINIVFVVIVVTIVFTVSLSLTTPTLVTS